MNLKSIYKLGSPPLFYNLCIVLEPWFLISSILLIAVGMYGGLFVAPPDYQMGDAFRIIYFHVPSAYVSMMAYVCHGYLSHYRFNMALKRCFFSGKKLCTYRRIFYIFSIDNWNALGQTYVGNCVGLGCKADL